MDDFENISLYPIIVRQLVFELRVFEINKDLNVNLSKENPIYDDDYDLFIKDFEQYSKQMQEKYTNSDNVYLKTLFDYTLRVGQKNKDQLLHTTTKR